MSKRKAKRLDQPGAVAWHVTYLDNYFRSFGTRPAELDHKTARAIETWKRVRAELTTAPFDESRPDKQAG